MGSFCTLGICIFSEFAISHKIGLIEQNENSIVTQTSERTRECSDFLSMCRPPEKIEREDFYQNVDRWIWNIGY